MDHVSRLAFRPAILKIRHLAVGLAAMGLLALVLAGCQTGTAQAGSSASAQAAVTSAGGRISAGSPRPMEAVTASQLADRMKIGWNLGNSLDAVGGETSWGNPRVTRSLIQAVAQAGFGVVRLPVTWTRHMGPAPDYTVDPAWLDRVEEVVGYVNDAGMVAIINVHHDGAENGDGEWLSLEDDNNEVTEAHSARVRDRFVKLWAQIAARFRNHDQNLVFESMNEIHVGYGPPMEEYFGIITDLNQAFVDTVRAGGGNNAGRCLLVPGYNTNIDHTIRGFERPIDSIADRLMLSVHFYDPWDFAGAGKTQVWGEGRPGADRYGQETAVLSQFNGLKFKFIQDGLPVIMGEYGAVNQTGYENYRRYYMEYVTKAARDRGIVPVYWDNGSKESGAEAFGLFNRGNGSVLYPEILEAMMRAANSDYKIGDIQKP